MRKIIFCIAFLCAISFAAMKDELFTGKCFTDSPLGGTENAGYSILYNDTLDELAFYYNDGYYVIVFGLDSSAIGAIQTNIQKFYKWDKAARKEKVNVSNRDLPVPDVFVNYSASTIVQESGTARLKMMFSSSEGQSAMGIIFFGENFNKIFLFDSRMVKSLQANISEDNVRRAVEKKKKKKKKLDEIFN